MRDRTPPGPAMASRILWLLAPILLFVGIISHRAELRDVLVALTDAAPLWLAVALLLQVGFAINQAGLYQVLFRFADAMISMSTALVMALAMAFTSLASPGGTAVGLAYVAVLARQRGIRASRAIVATLVYYVFDYAALALMLIAVVPVLIAYPGVDRVALVIAGVLTAGVLAVPGTLLWLTRNPGVLRRIREPLGRLLSRFRLRPDLLETSADALQHTLMLIRRSPRYAIRAFVHAVLIQAINVATLIAVFQALGTPVPFNIAVGSYVIGAVLMIVSVTPSGIGIVETAMTFYLASQGLPLQMAAAATLLFRLFTFWVPMLAGFASVQVAGRET